MSRLLDPQSTPSDLVAAALAGDQRAWDEIVDRYHLLVWKTVNGVVHDDNDREDAYSRTWCRLHESLRSIREPERLAGWLRTTAAREAIAVGRGTKAAVPVGDDRQLDRSEDVVAPSLRWRPEQRALDDEQAAAVRRAFSRLDEPCRELLSLLILQDEPLSYAEIGRRLGRPHGWIGPTRRRCLQKLRETPELRALFGPDPEEN